MTNKHLSAAQCAGVADRAAGHLFNYCRASNIHYAVLGVSGGLDSAVTAALAKRAADLAAQSGYQLRVVGVLMPCGSDPEHTGRGEEVIAKYGIERIEAPLDKVNKCAWDYSLGNIDWQIISIMQKNGSFPGQEEWERSSRIARGNVKARLRMVVNYHIARMFNGLVLSTDNLSEFWMAFWTICGDVGDYAMIQKLLKGTELYDLAKYLEVPESVLRAKPDDGLGIAGGDADQLGAEYIVIDDIMVSLINKGFDPDGDRAQLENLPVLTGYDPELVRQLATRALNGAYKRKGTVILEREDLGLEPIL